MQRVNVRPVTVTWCGRGPHLARLRCVPGVSINRVLKLTGAVSTTCHSMRSVTALHHPSPSTPHSELELCTVPWECGSWTRSYWIMQMLMLSSKAKDYVCVGPFEPAVSEFIQFTLGTPRSFCSCAPTPRGQTQSPSFSVMKIWN